MGRALLLGTALVLAIALAAAGCGGDDETSSTAAGASGASGAAGATADGTGGVPLDGPPDPALTVAQVAEQLPLPGPVIDNPQFHEDLDVLIAAGHKFWSETLSDIDVAYHTPDEFIAYDGRSGDQGPDCGGEPAGTQNAAYCRVPGSKYGIVAWDESGLLYPFYRNQGDGAVAFVMAHEYAHLAQDRLGIIQKFPLTVEKELNADCLAGAQWTAYDSAGAAFGKPEIESIINGISIAGDQPGTPWQDIHAHGSADDRLTAFFDGYEHDVKFCLDTYAPGFSRG